MNSQYKGKAIAGTATVDPAWRIVRERVVNHYSRISTCYEPEFVELVGVDIEQVYLGFYPSPIANISYRVQS